jgi:hypothetical protein
MLQLGLLSLLQLLDSVWFNLTETGLRLRVLLMPKITVNTTLITATFSVQHLPILKT